MRKQRPRKMKGSGPSPKQTEERSSVRLLTPSSTHFPHHPTPPGHSALLLASARAAQLEMSESRRHHKENLQEPSSVTHVLPPAARQSGRWGWGRACVPSIPTTLWCCQQSVLLRVCSGHHSRGAWGVWLALCLTWNPSCYSNTPLHVTAAPGPSSASAHTGTRAWGPWGLAQVCVRGERWSSRLCVSGSPVGGGCCRAGTWMEQ